MNLIKKTLIAASVLLFSVSSFAQDTAFWNLKYAPSWRHMLSATMVTDDVFFGAGGWYSDDSITTVVKSVDAGKNWSKRIDKVSPILQSIDFPTDSVGYAVGWYGSVWKTTDQGNSWTQINISGNAGARHFNACVFTDAQTGYIVGGNPSNDAIQTILKTTDGGDNWSVQKDGLGPWLLSVSALDADNLIAVGNEGTILKTSNGGSEWVKISAPGSTSNRMISDVHYVSSTLALAVGGWPDSDSIQTVIRSTDGGDSWNIITDKVASMLYAVAMYSTTSGYVAGDDGTLLITHDAGATWNEYVIEDTESLDFRSIDFRNENQGIIGGLFGALLMYNDSTKESADIAINDLVHRNSPTTALLTGSVRPKGFETQITVEYGTDSAFDLTGSATPETTSSDQEIELDIQLSGLEDQKLYQVRLKAVNPYGTAYSEIVSFIAGASPIPNYSFELWEEKYDTTLDHWNQVGSVKQEDHDGGTAVCLATFDGEPGAIILGDINDGVTTPGIAIAGKPDSIVVDLKYAIAAGDTANILSIFLKDGQVIGQHLVYLDGHTSNEFKRHAFAYDVTLPQVPDSLTIALVNTHVLQGSINDESWLCADNLSFVSGSTIEVPNSDFEDWTINTTTVPLSWTTQQEDRNIGQMMFQEPEAYRGMYAMKLANVEGEDFAHMTNGEMVINEGPNIAVPANYSSFFVHLKYFPQNGDSLLAVAAMYSNGEMIGEGLEFIDQEVPNFERYTIPIQYWKEAQVDSARIHFMIVNQGQVPAASYAIIDHLSFGSLYSSVEESDLNAMTAYPNPFDDQLNVVWEEQTELRQVQITDLSGRIVFNQDITEVQQHYQFEINSLQSGMYLLSLYTENQRQTLLIIKQ